MDIFGTLLVASRVGTALLLMLGIGARALPMKIRLFLVIGCSLAISPTVLTVSMPSSSMLALEIVIHELILGIFIGSIGMILFQALYLAGSVISSQSSLSMATTMDPTSKHQDTSITSFLAVTGTLCVFLSGTHLFLMEALVGSYRIFPVAVGLNYGFMASTLTEIMQESFYLALRLASPFLVYSVVFYFGCGLLNKLAPQMQVFFVALPLQILLSLSLLALSFGVIISVFLSSYREKISELVL